MIVLALINLPILIVRYNQGLFHLFVLDVPILTFSTLSVIAYYVVPQWYLQSEDVEAHAQIHAVCDEHGNCADVFKRAGCDRSSDGSEDRLSCERPISDRRDGRHDLGEEALRAAASVCPVLECSLRSISSSRSGTRLIAAYSARFRFCSSTFSATHTPP